MHSLLKEILEIPGIKIKEFEELFDGKFTEILDTCQLVKLKEDIRFIEDDGQIDQIWLLLKGQVKALEEFSTGDIYTFSRFPAPEVFGEMEVLAGVHRFRATLITESPCVFLTLPVEAYRSFLKANSGYLYQRTNLILKRVLDEQKFMRTFFMIKSIDRIKIYLVRNYKDEDGKCSLRITRQQIAEETGYAVKTVNRVIKKLHDDDLLRIEGQRIIIRKDQYQKMYKSVKNYINY